MSNTSSVDALAARVNALRQYCNSLTGYSRLLTREVSIGSTPLGGHHPIRIQSMTTADTLNTEATVAEALRMAQAGCEYIRITAPSKKEAENLANIKAELRRQGCNVPLVADIHFTPNAAEIAARIVEKVRVNPGNYADKKQFKVIEYTDAQYQAELERIAQRFSPLVRICQEHGTVMRIGTNHGSLSDRIMSRYGDSPEGMVESALEFVRICEALGYYDLVISMKASNALVMVQAYRLLAARMLAGETRFVYPLHVGVTEAGDGQDGRIKSAMGIGTLLADGIGDTVRVSLTEPPEAEMPVGRYIVNQFVRPAGQPATPVAGYTQPQYIGNPFVFHRRDTHTVRNFGSAELPRVISDLSHKVVDEWDMRQVGHVYWPESDKWSMLETGTDYVYAGGREVPFMLPSGTRAVYDAPLWLALPADQRSTCYPLFASPAEWQSAATASPELNFVRLAAAEALSADLATKLASSPVVLVLPSEGPYPMHTWRQRIFQLQELGANIPAVLHSVISPATDIPEETPEHRFQLHAASEMGMLLVDGRVDGVWLTAAAPQQFGPALLNSTAFGLLQAARLRTTKTEYISCPSCGRTLFDLQETTAMIRARTEHLKGVKIGIMGCIVNGPGEMADADYGYVGAGPGIISLWRGQEQIKGKVPAEHAVQELIELIRADGRWVEPPQ